MNRAWLYLVLLIAIALVSCDFNITDKPGPQHSGSVENAKLHHTFICEYKINGNRINTHQIKTIFVEHQFWRNSESFNSKEINCCESQLIIVSNDCLQCDQGGFGYEWSIKGFELISSYSIKSDFKGVAFPDNLKLILINSDSGKKAFTLLSLTKVK